MTKCPCNAFFFFFFPRPLFDLFAKFRMTRTTLARATIYRKHADKSHPPPPLLSSEATMAAIRAASVVLIPTRASSSFSQAKKKNGASAKKSQNALSPSFAKTSSSVATRAIGMGHAAPQRREGDPFDPHASQRQHEPGSNVWHESPPMVNQQLDIIAPNGEHNSHANDDAEQYFDEGAPPPSSPFVNPNTPSYIYELESARVRCIELEARAVQERDYLTASKSAKHIERLVEIESEVGLKGGGAQAMITDGYGKSLFLIFLFKCLLEGVCLSVSQR